MILELEILNFPQELASKKFKSFIDTKFDVSESQIVHLQTSSNKKILIYRLRNEQKFNLMLNSKAEFLEKTFEFKAFTRPTIEKINIMLHQRRIERESGIPYSDQSDISKVYLSNIPNCLNDKILRKLLSRFGPIDETDIIDRSRDNSAKVNKFKFAVVKFEDFESAVNAFFYDKVKIGKKKAKIKLYMEEKASRFYRKDLPLRTKGSSITGKKGQDGSRGAKGQIEDEKTPKDIGNYDNNNLLLSCLRTRHVNFNTTAKNSHLFMINHQLVSEGRYKARCLRFQRYYEQKFSSDELPKINLTKTQEIPEVGVNHFSRNLRLNVEKLESVAQRQQEYKFFEDRRKQFQPFQQHQGF